MQVGFCHCFYKLCVMLIRENISLKNYNTFGIQAAARYFAECTTIDDLKEVLNDKILGSQERLILGGGSNLLFTKDFAGIVLKNNLKGIDLVGEDEDNYYVKAAAGEVWHEFVLHCIANNYAGLENLSLIPGCVGASPMQNIGAYGVEIKDSFYELEALSIDDLSITKFDAKACEFGYRESVFKRKLKGKFIIISVTFRLAKKPVFNTSYGAIEKELEAMGVKELSIQAISNAVCNIRSSKLPNPKEIGNAGSFFKNPVVSLNHFEKLKAAYPDIVSYPSGDGAFKLAAGWLIEQAGWKGQRLGDAGVHKLQALVLVNYGNARGAEIFDLSGKIIQSVKEKFAVELEREVNII